MTNVYLLILFLVLTIKNVENRKAINVTKLKCENLDEEFCEIKTCDLSYSKQHGSVASFRLGLLQKPVTNVMLGIKIKKMQTAQSKIVFAYTIDGCEFMKNKESNRIAEMFYVLLGFEKYTNANHTCPYDHDLIIDQYHFDEKHINMIPIPVGNYNFISLWSVNNISRFKFDIDFSFLELN